MVFFFTDHRELPSRLARPDYVQFALDTKDITSCLSMVERGIFASAWLATEARKELRAFKQFLTFLRYGGLDLLLLGYDPSDLDQRQQLPT